MEHDANMIDPSIPLRSFEEIEYPGHKHPSILEIRSGMMERKSKYLKSFSPGWYVLTPMYLHEFKSSDRTRDLTPLMSLYLPESSLGKTSDPHATSHKFMLKARQTGHLHRGHSWVFRAGSHDEMIGWYEDIQRLTEVSAVERNDFVADIARRRTLSNATRKTDKAESYSSDNDDVFENDDADAVPYSGDASMLEEPQIHREETVRRPEGGRFPSDIQVNRGLEHRNSTSADSSHSAIAIAAAGALPGESYPGYQNNSVGKDEAPGTEMSPTFGEHIYPPGMGERQHTRSSTWSFEEQVCALLVCSLLCFALIW